MVFVVSEFILFEPINSSTGDSLLGHEPEDVQADDTDQYDSACDNAQL